MSNLPSQCSAYPPQGNADNVANAASTILSKMSAASQGCDLNSFNTAIAGQISGPLGMGSAGFAAQASDLKKSGCQSLAAIVGNFTNSVYQARCIIENDDVSATTTVSIDQVVNLNAIGPGSSIQSNCPNGSNWTQNADIKAKVISTISKTSSAKIAEIVQQGLKNTADQIGQIKGGYQGTDSGFQALSSIQSKLQNASQSSQLSNTLTKLAENFSINQGFNYNAIAGGKIGIVPCVWTANAIIDLQIANIVSAAYTSDITSAVSSFLKSTDSQKVSVISQGVPDSIGAMFNALKSNWIVIVGIIVFLIIGVAAFKFMKSKQGQKLMQDASNKIGASKNISMAFRKKQFRF